MGFVEFDNDLGVRLFNLNGYDDAVRRETRGSENGLWNQTIGGDGQGPGPTFRYLGLRTMRTGETDARSRTSQNNDYTGDAEFWDVVTPSDEDSGYGDLVVSIPGMEGAISLSPLRVLD